MSNFLNIKFENHKVPEFKEVKNKAWVYYGDNNLYSEYLIELATRSSTHGAILEGKINYVAGMGLTYDSKGSSLQAKAIANKFIRQIYDDGFYRKMISDYEYFNGFFIEPIFSKSGKKLTSINYIPFNKMRVSADEKTYYYSNDWKQVNQSEEKTGLKEFKPFDFENPGSNQLYYFRTLSPKNGKEKNVYPVPTYIGGTASIETEVEIDNYHLNNIKTGFSIGTIINFNNGVPTDEAKEEIETSLKKKFQGTDKAGSVAITFNNSADNAPTITSFAPSDLDKQFILIGDRVRQAIFTSHRISSPTLFGVATAGALGQRNEMIDAYELFQNTYVEPRQSIIEGVLNMFGQIFGLTTKIKINRLQPVQRNLPDATIQRVYDSYPVEQLAELMGLPPVKKTIPVQMAKQEEDIYEVLFSREWNGESDEEAILEFQKMQFKSELTANEKAIIDLLSKDELMPSEGIAKVLKISIDEVNKIIDTLNKGGYLEETSATNKGADIVEKEGAKTEMLKVLYKYDWRPNVTPDSNAREFCKEALDKYKSQSGWLTRDEIDSLKNDLGTDVWSTRGGWWNNGTANVPYCRHNWFQQIVKNK